jgi:hypothetical protein
MTFEIHSQESGSDGPGGRFDQPGVRDEYRLAIPGPINCEGIRPSFYFDSLLNLPG